MELWGSLPGTDTGFLQVLLLILSPGGSIALRLENGLCGEHPFKLKENVSKRAKLKTRTLARTRKPTTQNLNSLCYNVPSLLFLVCRV